MACLTQRRPRAQCAASALAAAPLALVSVATAVQAHTGADAAELAHPWQSWSLDPLPWTLTALFAWLFLRGVVLGARRARPVAPGRVTAFLAGLALVAAALVSPLDFFAGHLFWAHQIQHMILAAAPQGVIFNGMPRRLKLWALGPILRSRRLVWLGHALTRPAAATVLFIATLYVWEIPALHDAALLDEPLHYFMHVSMLASGMLFFWVIFDRRDPPKGTAHGHRQIMLLSAFIAEILIGAFTTLKTVELYPAYDIAGRLYDMAPMADEVAGGFLIWAPACMMFLLALLLSIHRWNGTEERQWQRRARGGPRGGHGGFGANSGALFMPETAEELWLSVQMRNRRQGLGLGAVALIMFMLTIGVAVTASVLH